MLFLGESNVWRWLGTWAEMQFFIYQKEIKSDIISLFCSHVVGIQVFFQDSNNHFAFTLKSIPANLRWINRILAADFWVCKRGVFAVTVRGVCKRMVTLGCTHSTDRTQHQTPTTICSYESKLQQPPFLSFCFTPSFYAKYIAGRGWGGACIDRYSATLLNLQGLLSLSLSLWVIFL